jgi:hypothetical protein
VIQDRQALVRALPFAVFILFLALEDHADAWLGEAFDTRWLYSVKAALVAMVLITLARNYGELREPPGNRMWLWLGAPLVGALVFVLWINLDFAWLKLGVPSGFDPRDTASGTIDWRLAAARLAGAALMVPLMEELFWRSFLMRWIDRHAFLNLAPAAVSLKAVLISSLVFGFAHSLWFAGFLAGLAYAWLYRASGSLWTAIAAHAVTNAMLGIWVLRTGNWQFW